MKRTILTKEGKWLEINPATDTWIIKIPRPTARVGSDYAQGEDLYLMDDTSGTRHYYVISWLSWSREFKESFHTLNEEQAHQFILDHKKKAGKIGLDPDVVDKIDKYFPNLLKTKR